MARQAAFEILYREYYTRVFGLCRRLLNSRDLAEDATQEVFMRAYKNLGKYKSEQPFWQWIATIANNHCIDRLRARSRSEQVFGDETQELADLAAEEMSMLGGIISLENSELLNDALTSLPDKYRVPLVLAYFNQNSYEEIAAQLDVSTSHVGVLLLRGKQRLQHKLADQDVHIGQGDQA